MAIAMPGAFQARSELSTYASSPASTPARGVLAGLDGAQAVATTSSDKKRARNLCVRRLSGAALKEVFVMSEAFHMGGWGMYPTLVFGILLVAASVRYAISPERRFVPLQVSLGILTLVGGGLGFITGTIKSFMA